ncbi:MAG: hypothetical protein AAGK98_03275 [Pseudomonadota bacterium]
MRRSGPVWRGPLTMSGTAAGMPDAGHRPNRLSGITDQMRQSRLRLRRTRVMFDPLLKKTTGETIRP